MTALSPVEDKARSRDSSATRISSRTARRHLTLSAALAQQHLEEGVGEDVDSLNTPPVLVGQRLSLLGVLFLGWAGGPRSFKREVGFVRRWSLNLRTDQIPEPSLV